MANPTEYDLNEAINQWRSSLASSPGISTADLEELESHLRDTVEELKTTGLAADEAFLIARKRLGGCNEIQEEFEKSNPSRVWAERAFLMVGFMLLTFLLSSAFSCLGTVATAGVVPFVSPGVWLTTAGVTAKAIFDLIGLWVLARIITQGGFRITRTCELIRKYPVKCVLSIVFACLAVRTVDAGLHIVLFRTLGPADIGHLTLWTSAETLVQQLLFYVVIILAVRSLRLKRVAI